MSKYCMKHLESMPVTKLLPTVWRRITPRNLLLIGGWKIMWLQEKKG